jgi:DNA repair ATPase RecN
MTGVSTADAAQLATIQALRQVSDSMNAIGRRMDRQGETLDDIQRRVIRLEEARTSHQIDELKQELDDARQRLALLESERDHRRGALSLVKWLKDYTPWLLAITLAALAWWQKDAGPAG